MSIDIRTLETATYQAMGRNLKVCIVIRDHLVLSGHINRLKMAGYIQEYREFLENSSGGNANTQRVALQRMLKCVSQGTPEQQQQAYFRTALVRRFRFELEKNQWLLTMVGIVETWLEKQLARGQPVPSCPTNGLPKFLRHFILYETQEDQPLTTVCRLLRVHCDLNTDSEYRRQAFCLYLEKAGAATYDELMAVKQAPLTYFPNRIYPDNEARDLLDAVMKMPPPKHVVPEWYTMGAAWDSVNKATGEFPYGDETTSACARYVGLQSKRADQTVLSTGHPRDMAKRSFPPVTDHVVDIAAIETFGNNVSSASNSRKRRHEDERRETNGHVDKIALKTSQPAKRQKIMDDLEENRRRMTLLLHQEFQGLKRQSSSRKHSGVHRHTGASSTKSTNAGITLKTNRKSSAGSSDQVLKKRV